MDLYGRAAQIRLLIRDRDSKFTATLPCGVKPWRAGPHRRGHRLHAVPAS
jgi:hypothetical protein